MNSEFILYRIKPYLKNGNQILDEDFNHVFKSLELHERIEVKNALYELGIEVVLNMAVDIGNQVTPFVFNEEEILNRINPLLNSNKEILEKNFHLLFQHLGLKNCYKITDFLLNQGINIIYDEDDSDLESLMDLNDKSVIEAIKPYLVDNSITEEKFNELFGQFDLQDHYKISDILMDYDISIIYKDEDVVVNPTVELTEKEDLVANEYYVPFKGFEHPIEITNGEIKNLKSIDNELLCSAYQQGNQSALYALIYNNQKLVCKRALKYGKIYNHSLDFEDLVSLGNEGLMEAVKKFDFGRDNRFSTYATWWIDQKIRRGIMDTGFTVRIPVHRFEDINKLLKIRNLDGIETESQAFEWLSKEEGFSDEKISELKKWMDYCYSSTSLNTLMGEDGDTELIEMIGDYTVPLIEDQVSQIMLKDELNNILESLSDREERIIRLRFGLDDGVIKTLEEIGVEFGVTRERIRQIEIKALRKLRDPSRSKRLIDFFEC